MNEQNTQKSIIIFSAEKQIENKPPSISHRPPKRRGEIKLLACTPDFSIKYDLQKNWKI